MGGKQLFSQIIKHSSTQTARDYVSTHGLAAYMLSV